MKLKLLKYPSCLNIGSGSEYREGWMNVDVNANAIPKPDKIADIRKLPFPKNTFSKVYCHHVLEHIPSPISEVMEELWRVLKPNGELEVHVPHFAFHGAFCHPEHVHYFDVHTFQHFTPKILDDAKTNQYPKPICRFELISCEYRYRETDHTNTRLSCLKMGMIAIINWFANHHRDFFDRTMCYWVGGCEEIVVKMKAIK